MIGRHVSKVQKWRSGEPVYCFRYNQWHLIRLGPDNQWWRWDRMELLASLMSATWHRNITQRFCLTLTKASTTSRSTSTVCTHSTPKQSQKQYPTTRQTESLELDTWHFTTRKFSTSAGSYHTCSTPLGPLSTFEIVHGPHHYWRIRCLSRVWSGTTLCRTPVQLLCSSNSTYSIRSLGQPGGGSRLPKPR